ncbi:MAG: amidohydrolase family protein [Lysobacterales bacterium]
MKKSSKCVDVDTHVIEPSSVWNYLSSSDQEFLPSIMQKQSGASVSANFASKNTQEFWVIDNQLYGKHNAELIAQYSNGEVTAGAITLDDVAARLKTMDNQSVDVQVIFSSLFLNIRCHRANAELALTRAYNRWIAERCSDSNNRLRWVFVPSLKNPQETIKDMRAAKNQGAVGVLFRGLEGDKYLDHADFDPVYRQAMELDLPICVHIGHGSPAFESIEGRSGAGFNRFISDCPNYLAYSVLLNSQLPSKFPDLRFGFFEAGCSWLAAATQTALHLRLSPADLKQRVSEKLEEHNFFITCELHEDLPYVLGFTGEDRLMAGSDYGHPGDIADTIMYRDKLTERGDLSEELQEKLLSTNPLRLFVL